jgi:hypothetical protein
MVKVNVYWYKKTEGGRNSIPSVCEYSTIAKFKDEGVDWPKIAWSMILYFDTPPSIQGENSIGLAKFLTSDAPKEKLKSGTEFELYEGYKKVALVSVI